MYIKVSCGQKYDFLGSLGYQVPRFNNLYELPDCGYYCGYLLRQCDLYFTTMHYYLLLLTLTF